MEVTKGGESLKLSPTRKARLPENPGSKMRTPLRTSGRAPRWRYGGGGRGGRDWLEHVRKPGTALGLSLLAKSTPLCPTQLTVNATCVDSLGSSSTRQIDR